MIECNDGIVDLDEGLDLRDDFQKELQDSMEYVQTGGRILSAEDVVIRLQLEHENLLHVSDQVQEKLPNILENELLQDVA